MIAGIFHQGSGLGNQLHRYVMIRVLAEDKGYEWGMTGTFKGNFFLEQPKVVSDPPMWLLKGGAVKQWHEKKIVENGVDIRGYDPEINFVEDNTVIDGEFQDPRYFEHRMDNVAGWLKTEPLSVPDNVCVIGFRGGEYSIYSDLFLPQGYWDMAIKRMREINPLMEFRVVTDDPLLARQFFPDFVISHDVGTDWRSVRYSRYSIVANSSFYILPRLLQHHQNKDALTIAPRYWARYNTRVWALPQNYYKQFSYIHHESDTDKGGASMAV